MNYYFFHKVSFLYFKKTLIYKTELTLKKKKQVLQFENFKFAF